MTYSRSETKFLLNLSPVRAVEYPVRVPRRPFSSRDDARLMALSPTRFTKQTMLGSSCGCGCGGRGTCDGMGGLGSTLTSYFCARDQAVQNIAKEINNSAMISSVAAGAIGGFLGAIFKRPLIGTISGSVIGLAVYHTQKATF